MSKNKIKTLKDALLYIYSFIPKGNSSLFPGEIGLRRTKYALTLLNNPQESFKIIHIAGTSGKGSTAVIISSLLQVHGFKVGLVVKPHLFDIRERYLINQKMISEKDFCLYVNLLTPVVEKIKLTEFGSLTYAEINVLLAFLIFKDKHVDYAVIETYLGGLFDCTNVISRQDKIVVLTRIGFDHTKILGNTLKLIAGQKAGIIQLNNPVIALRQLPQVNKIFIAKAKQMSSAFHFVTPQSTFIHTKQTDHGIQFDFVPSSLLYKNEERVTKKTIFPDLKKLHLNMFGLFQAENASLALAAFYYTASRDGFSINEKQIRLALANIYFAGRLERINIRGKTIIIDGAHNPQKMKAFLTSLKSMFPHRKFDFLIAFVSGKDVSSMVTLIAKEAQFITLSKFFVDYQDWIRKAEDPVAIGKILKSRKFSNFNIKSQAGSALGFALNKTPDVLVITGSLYFIGELHKQLYFRQNEQLSVL